MADFLTAVLTTPTAAAPCRLSDLDGTWRLSSITHGDEAGGDFYTASGMSRCAIAFRRGTAINVRCPTHSVFVIPSIADWTTRFEPNLRARLFRNCRFKWDLADGNGEGYFMGGQMNLSKDTINGTFKLLWSVSGFGEFSMTRMP